MAICGGWKIAFAKKSMTSSFSLESIKAKDFSTILEIQSSGKSASP